MTLPNISMGRAFKYVIVGGGNSAGYAAHEFIQQGVGVGEVCIVSEEAVAPYERPALSKGYLSPEKPARLSSIYTCAGEGKSIQSPKWYKDNGVELALSTRVISVDANRRSLLTHVGETITFQYLIIATGARALKLEEFGVRGADCKNVFYLRDIRDADHLVAAMATLKGSRAVVVGGGYIGMEVAAALVSNSISVTIVFPEQHLMTRLFTPEMAEFYERAYRNRGVVFRKETVVAAVEQNQSGEVAGVVLKDGSRVPCEMVVVGVGIRPNVSLFEGQLALHKGAIRVNGQLQTSSSHVYAIGDATSFPVPLYGGALRRTEHVSHARKSAVHVVRAILHPTETGDYEYLPYFYSRVFVHSWQFFGDNAGACLLFGDLSGDTNGSSKFGAYWVSEEGRVVGAFLEGGKSAEYEAMEKVAREQPFVEEDWEVLSRKGVLYALEYSEKSADAAARAESVEPQSATLLPRAVDWGLAQAAAGVAMAAFITVAGYYNARSRNKW